MGLNLCSASYYPFGCVWGYSTQILDHNVTPYLIGYQSYVLSFLSLISSWFQYQPNQQPPFFLLLLVFSFHIFLCGDLSVMLESDASSYFSTTSSSINFLPGNIYWFHVSNFLACMFTWLYPSFQEVLRD